MFLVEPREAMRMNIRHTTFLGWFARQALACLLLCILMTLANPFATIAYATGADQLLTPTFAHKSTRGVAWQNPSDYPQVSALSVRLPDYCTGYHTYVTPSRIPVGATRMQCIEAFIARAHEYLGTPYHEPWAREPGVGIDCSGLVLQCLYATGMDLEHARGSEAYGGYNPYNHYWVPPQTYNSLCWETSGTFTPVRLSNIQRGDVLYYHGHVSIYLGNGKIIHAVPPVVCIADMGKPTSAGRPFV